MKNVLTWLIKSLAVFLLGIPVTLLGLPLVALALPFRTIHEDTARPFTQYPGTWKLVTLPFWAKPWSNEFDGSYGDKRGWWDNYCQTNYKKSCTAFRSMWQWTAIRNPANYWSRVITGVDVSRCVVSKLAGDDVVDEVPGRWQWQFLCATHESGKLYHRLFCIFPWFFKPDHCVMIDIGWKIKLAHNGMSRNADQKDRVRGSVFGLSPWKKL